MKVKESEYLVHCSVITAEPESAWSRLLEHMHACLEQQEKSRPTLEGRRLIVQMIVGGVTPYLTQVQGMPSNIESRMIQAEERAGKVELSEGESAMKKMVSVSLWARNKDNTFTAFFFPWQCGRVYLCA